MIAAVQPTVDAVADLVGVVPRPVIDPCHIEFKVQRDSLSAEWRDRFLATYGDRDWLDEF